MNILVADDEVEIVDILKLYLEKEGFKVSTAYNGKDALELVKIRDFDLLILDIMMPGEKGYTIIQAKPAHIPAICISAKSSTSDRILGLDLGADDYIVKPFDPLEVLARVKAVLRRKTRDVKQEAGDVSIDQKSHRVFVKEKEVELTAKEFDLLALFLRNINVALSREKISSSLWPDDPYLDENTLRVHIGNLRNKIALSEKTRIKTLRNRGYRMEIVSSE